MVWIIIAVIVLLIIVWMISAYNNLVTLRNRVKNGWAQIDVQLKQRADLVPNLVETVKGYATHESRYSRRSPRLARRPSPWPPTSRRVLRNASPQRTS